MSITKKSWIFFGVIFCVFLIISVSTLVPKVSSEPILKQIEEDGQSNRFQSHLKSLIKNIDNKYDRSIKSQKLINHFASPS